MPVDGVPPFALYVPGADTALNESRRLHVRGAVIHTTQGVDSRELGARRRHSTPGTFNFLIRDGVLYCYYPAWVRCSHAAGGNFIGPGIEIEMFDGQPVATEDLITLGRLILWLNKEYGVSLNYKEGDPRIWADKTTFKGFIAHAGLDYPPNVSFRHYDNITESEFARALQLVGGDDVPEFVGKDAAGQNWRFSGAFRTRITPASRIALVGYFGHKPLGEPINEFALDAWKDVDGTWRKVLAWAAKLFPGSEPPAL